MDTKKRGLSCRYWSCEVQGRRLAKQPGDPGRCCSDRNLVESNAQSSARGSRKSVRQGDACKKQKSKMRAAGIKVKGGPMAGS